MRGLIITKSDHPLHMYFNSEISDKIADALKSRVIDW